MDSPSTVQSTIGVEGRFLPEQTIIPPQLRFLMSNIKNVVINPLTANYPMWKSQVLKIFRANGFHGFLDGTCSSPSQFLLNSAGESVLNPQYTTWTLVDQNLAAALSFVISSAIQPYILSIEHCFEIWISLGRRLQSTTRSRISQLKNEIHHCMMKDQTMAQYLLDIKSKVDALAAAGSPLDPEDVIHYTLNGLPSSYQAFKTAIRTNLQPLALEDFYTLLCSEELNLAHEACRDLQNLQISSNVVALVAPKSRGRGRFQSNRGRSTMFPKQPSGSAPPTHGGRPPRASVFCQICGKLGHTAVRCWYRHDPQYSTDPPAVASAFFTPSDAPIPAADTNWYLDSGASSHLTSDPSFIQTPKSYAGSNQVVLGNGQHLLIQHTGNGLLPTPSGSEDTPASSSGTLY